MTERLRHGRPEGIPLFRLHSSGQPAHAAEEVEQTAQIGGGVLDPAKQRGGLPHLGNVRVRHLLYTLHTVGRGLGAGDGAAREQSAQPLQIGGRVRHPEADQRVAAAQMVVEEGQGRADGEAVEPEGDLRQLDGQGILVDAVDTALEDHPPDDGLVGQLGRVDDPLRLPGPAEDVPPDRGDAVDQGRSVLVEPLRDGRDVLDQVGDVVGEEVDGCDEEVTAAHRRIEDLQVEHRLGRIQLEQLGVPDGLMPVVALELLRLFLESLQALLDQAASGCDRRSDRRAPGACRSCRCPCGHRDWAGW